MNSTFVVTESKTKFLLPLRERPNATNKQNSQMENLIYYSLANSNAKVPTRGTMRSAGLDLYTIDELLTIPPRENRVCQTGVKIQLPKNYCSLIMG